jgi:hypothetical protein
VRERGGELHALLGAERELLDALRRTLRDPEAVDPTGGRCAAAASSRPWAAR